MIKRLQILVLILLLSTLVFAISERVTLTPGENFVIKDKNITLINSAKDRVIICVNNQKSIVSTDEVKFVNDVEVDLRDASSKEADFKFSYSCSDCSCTEENCSNDWCFDECKKNTDCDDNNRYTEDICSGVPRKCSHKLMEENIKEEQPVEEVEEVQEGCKINNDCADGNECTKDICFKGSCLHSNICEEKSDDLSNGTNINALLGITTILVVLLLFMVILIFNRYRG